MEKKGIPVVLETWNFPDIIDLTKKAFMMEGVPEVRMALTAPDTAITSLKQFIPDMIKALTTPLTDKEKYKGTYKPDIRPRIAMLGTYDEVQSFYIGDLSRFPAGVPPHPLMTDGLPVTPPTEAKLAQMLRGTSHKPDEIIWVNKSKGGTPTTAMPWNGLHATVEKVAINAVMAGCTPEMLPVVLAGTELGACVGSTSD